MKLAIRLARNEIIFRGKKASQNRISKHLQWRHGTPFWMGNISSVSGFFTKQYINLCWNWKGSAKISRNFVTKRKYLIV